MFDYRTVDALLRQRAPKTFEVCSAFVALLFLTVPRFSLFSSLTMSQSINSNFRSILPFFSYPFWKIEKKKRFPWRKIKFDRFSDLDVSYDWHYNLCLTRSLSRGILSCFLTSEHFSNARLKPLLCPVCPAPSFKPTSSFTLPKLYQHYMYPFSSANILIYLHITFCTLSLFPSSVSNSSIIDTCPSTWPASRKLTLGTLV